MTLADRLNQSISERSVTKAEFAHRLGVTENESYTFWQAASAQVLKKRALYRHSSQN